jgi:hypothetical protein
MYNNSIPRLNRRIGQDTLTPVQTIICRTNLLGGKLACLIIITSACDRMMFSIRLVMAQAKEHGDDRI